MLDRAHRFNPAQASVRVTVCGSIYFDFEKEIFEYCFSAVKLKRGRVFRDTAPFLSIYRFA